jgi:transposase
MTWRQGLPYGQDLRDRVLAARDAGQSVRAVAERFSVSPSYVAKADRRRRRTGERRARRSSGRPPPKIVAHLPALTERVASQPDATLTELRGWLLAECGISVGLVTVWRALKRLGVTLKKRMARPVCKQCSATSLSSLRQRIRPEGVALAKMEIRASWSS